MEHCKTNSEFFFKSQAFGDELTNDEINEELGWTFQGFELKETQ